MILTEEMLTKNGFESFVTPNGKKIYYFNEKELVMFWNKGITISVFSVEKTITTVEEFIDGLKLIGKDDIADNFKA